MTATQLAGDLKMPLNKAAVHLRAFFDRELVSLMNPKAPYSRAYLVTKKALQARDWLVAKGHGCD